MDTALLLVRVALSVVLATAAVTKLAQWRGLPTTVRDMGVPSALVRPVAAVLPLVELAIAAALLVGAIAWEGSIAAALLFGAFTALVAFNIAKGRRPDCNCFGQLSADPISTTTIVRNVGLTTAAALVAVGGGGPGLFDWARTIVDEPADIGVWLALLTLGLAALTVLVIYRTRYAPAAAPAATTAAGAHQHDTASVPVAPSAGLPVGTQAPAFSATTLAGHTLSLQGLLNEGKGVVLVFTDPNCGPCAALMPEIAAWQQYRTDVRIVVLSRGDAEANAAKAHEYGLTEVALDAESSIAQLYRYEGTPGAVAIRPDGGIAAPLASGPDAVLTLLSEFSEQLGAEVPLGELTVGEPAPPLRLMTTHGHAIDLRDMRGHPVLVVFWDPLCGFCQRFLPRLRIWEEEEAEGKVWLLIVSKGDRSLIEAQGFQSHVALDPSSAVARSFGGFGTPTAVLVDAEGRVGSELAEGADEVLALGQRAAAIAEAAATLADLR